MFLHGIPILLGINYLKDNSEFQNQNSSMIIGLKDMRINMC